VLRRRWCGHRARWSVAMAVVVVCGFGGSAVGALPDDRGYELVSPPEKGGGDVMPMSTRTRAAAGGDAVGFTSLVSFGDVQGATLGSEYVSVRTGSVGTSGWATHGITPAQDPVPFFGQFLSLDPSYEGEMSPDLSTGVFRAFRPLTDTPNVAGLENLYVRRDLRTPGAGFYQLLTDPGFPVDAPFIPVRPFLVGASTDFSHVVFESTDRLSNDLPSCVSGIDCPQEVYESVNGNLRLASVLPDGTPAPSAQAGRGASSPNPKHTPRMISADGSRVLFQASDNVYMRIDGTRTIQLNTSERTVPDSPQPALLWTASVDGSRVFFQTGEQLIEGLDDSGFYMYDLNEPPGQHLTLVDRDQEPRDAHSAIGIAGASEDGHYVYFTEGGQLVADEEVLGPERGLYVWHDGVVRYIGQFANPDDTEFNDLAAPWVINAQALKARVTPDGRHLLFMTRSDAGFRGRGGFSGYDHGSGAAEFYLYSADDGRLRCASCNPTGAPATADADIGIHSDSESSNATSTSHMNRAISDDGHWVFFNTRDALVPQDINGRVDAYEYDSVTESVHLLSSGRAASDSYFLDSSASGQDVFIAARDRLNGWDVDDARDMYDVRVHGGPTGDLPDPIVPLPACTGEACQGNPTPPPTAGAASSGAFRGAGNLDEALHARPKPRKHCRHGTRRVVRRHVTRCIRRRTHRRHR
jgi:hypothetical protein